jgi:hypothetical protein
MTIEMQIIKRAREIISDPEKWCKGAFARNADGKETYCYDPNVIPPEATQFCGYGALVKAAIDTGQPWELAYDIAVNLVKGGCCLTDFTNVNDEQGHAAILSLFDKALAQEPQS